MTEIKFKLKFAIYVVLVVFLIGAISLVDSELWLEFLRVGKLLFEIF